MELKLECCMLLAFAGAVALLLMWHIQSGHRADAQERLGLMLAEVGFAAGAFMGLRTTGLLEFTISYLGMLLTLTTLAFAWPEKEENEVRALRK